MIFFTHNKKNISSNGQTLVETVIASGIAVLVLIALVGGITVSLRNIQFARNKSAATKYAQESFEAVRSIRDRDWSTITNGDHGLVWNPAPLAQWSFDGTADTIGQFTRVVTIADAAAADIKGVTIIISWREGSDTKDVTIYTMVAKL